MNWQEACKETGYASRMMSKKGVRVKIANGDEWHFESLDASTPSRRESSKADLFDDWEPLTIGTHLHTSVCMAVEALKGQKPLMTVRKLLQYLQREHNFAVGKLTGINYMEDDVHAQIDAVKNSLGRIISILETKVESRI